MLKLQLSLMGMVLCLITCSAITPPKDLYAKTISTKLTRTTKNYAGTYPQVTNHGNPATWVLISPASWTSGFFPATMYELHRRQTLCPSHSDGVNWLTRGRKWSDAILAMSNGNNQGHDQGFLSFPFVEELKINPKNTTAINAVNKFAKILASRYNPIVKCTRSWNTVSWPDDFEVIIDNMINLELLFVSADLTGNNTLRTIAINHADTTMKNHFRPDHSTYHLLHYNQSTGAVTSKVTSQGYADWSTWTRGQGWAMWGFTNMYKRTGYQRYLDTARAASELFLRRLPKSHVPPWDFDAPGNPATADTSAGAIAATALIYLASIEKSHGNSTGSTYLVNSAVNILSGISNLAWKPTWDSILSNGTANIPSGSSQTGLVYGDYYYVKAGNDLIANGYASCSVLA